MVAGSVSYLPPPKTLPIAQYTPQTRMIRYQCAARPSFAALDVRLRTPKEEAQPHLRTMRFTSGFKSHHIGLTHHLEGER